MDKNRIPVTLGGFNAYIVDVDIFLNRLIPGGSTTNGENLSMTLAELAKLREFRQQWISDDPSHPGIFQLHSSRSTKTYTTRAKIDELMRNFRTFFSPILIRMSVSSNIDSGSRLILRIAEPSGKRSHHKEPITESCWVRTTQIGGGSLKFRCQTASDSSRPSKPIMASALEIAYRIEIPLFDENGNLIRKTLASSSDGTTKILFTKAQSILHLGDKNICKYVNFFARWSNPTHPQLSGPWTGPFFEVIG